MAAMTTLIFVVGIGAVLSFATARTWPIGLTAAAILSYYLGLDSGWWGNGTGDAWQWAMLLVLVFAVGVTSLAVTLGRSRRG